MNIKIVLLLFLALTANNLFAQDLTEKDVPAVVMTTFKSKFADAVDTKWKKNKSGKYEADFKLSGKKAEAKFMADGTWDSSKKRMETSILPVSASEYVKKNFAGYKIDWVELQEESVATKNTYEVKIKKDKAETELTFDANGKFIKKKDKDKKDKVKKA